MEQYHLSIGVLVFLMLVSFLAKKNPPVPECSPEDQINHDYLYALMNNEWVLHWNDNIKTDKHKYLANKITCGKFTVMNPHHRWWGDEELSKFLCDDRDVTHCIKRKTKAEAASLYWRLMDEYCKSETRKSAQTVTKALQELNSTDGDNNG